MALQLPPIQVYETLAALPSPNATLIQFPLNTQFPRKLIYAYVFNGPDGAGAGGVALDYRFSANETALFSLPFIYNTTTNGVNRFTGGLPLPSDPLWPGDMSLFGWSNVGAASSSSENQLIFTPNNNGVTNGPFANEPNRTNLSPFEIVLTEANKLKIQPLFQSISATFRFWTCILQLPLLN